MQKKEASSNGDTKKTQQLEYWYRCNDTRMCGGCGSNKNLQCRSGSTAGRTESM